MLWRLKEGYGEAKYEIGLHDNGDAIGISKQEMLESLTTLCQLAHALKADVIVMKMKKGREGKVAEVMIR